MPQWRNGHFTVCECAKGLYGKMKAFCDIFLVDVAPPSKHIKEWKKKIIWKNISRPDKDHEWNYSHCKTLPINQDLLIIIDCKRIARLIGLCKWRQMIWLNVFLWFFSRLSILFSHIKFNQTSQNWSRYFAPMSDCECIIVRGSASIKIGISDRPITISKSVSDLNGSTPLTWRLDEYETKCIFLWTKQLRNLFGVLRYAFFVFGCCIAFSFSCASTFVRHLKFSVGISKPCRLVYAFNSGHNAPTVTAVHCEWLIMASLCVRISRADVNNNKKNIPNSRYGWFAQLMQ